MPFRCDRGRLSCLARRPMTAHRSGHGSRFRLPAPRAHISHTEFAALLAHARSGGCLAATLIHFFSLGSFHRIHPRTRMETFLSRLLILLERLRNATEPPASLSHV